MDSYITNSWITLEETYKGMTVRRKFAGLKSSIDINDKVILCIVEYHQQLLSSTGDVIESNLKSYSLVDLDSDIITIDGIKYSRPEILTLSGFIDSLGQTMIVNPANVTLEDLDLLPVDVENNYPLHRDTRVKTEIIEE